MQYDDPRAAQAAIEKENGTVIGGLRIDVNMADNRAVRSKEERRADRNAGNKREREERMPPRGDSRRHKGDDFSRSEFRGRDRDPRGDFRSGGGGGSRDPRAPFEPPSSLIDVFVVRVDNAGRSYCLFVEENITNLNLLYEMREVDLPDLPEALKTAAEKSQVKHIMVVGGRHEHTETVTLGTRLPNGKVEGKRSPPSLMAAATRASSSFSLSSTCPQSSARCQSSKPSGSLSVKLAPVRLGTHPCQVEASPVEAILTALRCVTLAPLSRVPTMAPRPFPCRPAVPWVLRDKVLV